MGEKEYYEMLQRALFEVGFYAYTEHCVNLDKDECRRLSDLCDKAKQGIDEWLWGVQNES